MLIMRFFDIFFRPKKNRVAVICKRQVGFNGNVRLVAEALDHIGYDVSVYWECSDDECCELKAKESFKNIKFYNSFSFNSVLAISTATIILLSHSIRDGYISRRKKNRKIINLWHGAPIKGIELAMPNLTRQRERVIRENANLYDYMIASSHIDKLAMSSCFGLKPSQVWITGLPRYDIFNDALIKNKKDLNDDKAKIKKFKAGRKLVLFAPTFREDGLSPLIQLGEKRLKEIIKAVNRHGAVLGIRLHRYDDSLWQENNFIDLSSKRFSETNIVLSETDVLITDFSSLWVDYQFTGKPVIGFSEDIESYEKNERGFLYDFHSIFPGKFYSDYLEFLGELESILMCGGVHQNKSAASTVFDFKHKSNFTDSVVKNILEECNE